MRINFIIILFFFFCLSTFTFQDASAQGKYYPEGTMWQLVKCIAPADGKIAFPKEEFLSYQAIVEGDTTIYNVVKEWDNRTILDSMRYQKVLHRTYDYYHNQVDSDTCFFRECGDSIFCCFYSRERLIYDYYNWREGEVLPGSIIRDPINKIEKVLLADGNYYDYWRSGSLIRYIGGVKGGVIPHSPCGRCGHYIYLSLFIRNDILIYQDDEIEYPEGYVTDIGKVQGPTPMAEGGTVYSLMGFPMDDKKALPPGIYIRKGKTIIVK